VGPFDERTPFVPEDYADVGTLEAEDVSSATAEGPSSGTKESQATKIVRDVQREDTELWQTPHGDVYMTFSVGQHREHHRLNSAACRDYLSRIYFRRARSAASSGAIAGAQDTLSAIARFEGQTHPIYVRLAEANDHIYLDLGDADWRVVDIDATGWRILRDPPVRFRRPRGLHPLPEPVRGGSIDALGRFLNVSSKEDFRLCVMWELAALRARGPYPILMFIAEQGAAKTTTTRVLRRLVDPNEADIRRPPRNTQDLMIAAANSHIVAFDNLSRISDELSDNLSALATGSGFSARQLYSNDEEHITHACRPILLNGISQFATRGDVLDRALTLTLPRIPDSQRKDERTFWSDFEAARPALLGAFLEAVSVGLRRVPDISLPRLPRMADFVVWSVAVEPACGWPVGQFLAGYGRNRMNAVTMLLEGDPLADVVRMLAENGWEGTATELLNEVNRRTPEDVKRRREWFAKPRQLSDELRRLIPALRKVGVTVIFPSRTGKRRGIRVRRSSASRPSTHEKSRSSASLASPASPAERTRADAGDELGDAASTSSPASPTSSPETPNRNGHCDDSDAGDDMEPLFSDEGPPTCCKGGVLQPQCKLCRQSPTYWDVPS